MDDQAGLFYDNIASRFNVDVTPDVFTFEKVLNVPP